MKARAGATPAGTPLGTGYQPCGGSGAVIAPFLAYYTNCPPVLVVSYFVAQTWPTSIVLSRRHSCAPAPPAPTTHRPPPPSAISVRLRVLLVAVCGSAALIRTCLGHAFGDRSGCDARNSSNLGRQRDCL